MAVQAKPRITDADLLALGEDVRAEVIDGELMIHMTPNRIDHSFYTQRIGTYLDVFVSARKLGRVFGDMAAYKLEADEEGGIKGSLVPDCSFISYERLPADAPINVIPTVAPDIAIEVISDTETHNDVLQKTTYYLDHGVRIVWHIIPALQEAHTFTAPHRTPTILTLDDMLTGGEVLSGFAVPVRAIFDHADTDLHVEVLKRLMGV